MHCRGEEEADENREEASIRPYQVTTSNSEITRALNRRCSENTSPRRKVFPQEEEQTDTGLSYQKAKSVL
jgi:hypothetical protein